MSEDRCSISHFLMNANVSSTVLYLPWYQILIQPLLLQQNKNYRPPGTGNIKGASRFCKPVV